MLPTLEGKSQQFPYRKCGWGSGTFRIESLAAIPSNSAQELLKVLGYEVDFVETDLINSKYKAKFLSKKNKTHDIIFLKCETCGNTVRTEF